jgi:hypothetical protein
MSDQPTRIGRGMRLAGRYRVVPTALWESTDFQRLSPTARLVLLALKTGSTSSFAGIGLVYGEGLQRETGLTPAEIEGALAELEKRPTPSTSWIVRSGPVIWVRHQLRSDPVVEKSGGKPNPDQQKGVSRHVGALPQDNIAVLRFLRHYREMLQTTEVETKGKTKGGTVGGTVGGSPAVAVAPAPAPSPSHTPAATRTTTSEPPPALSGVAPAARSEDQSHDRVRREDAPAEWFNDCPEGRYKKECVRYEYASRIDLAIECEDHRRKRAITAARAARVAG